MAKKPTDPTTSLPAALPAAPSVTEALADLDALCRLEEPAPDVLRAAVAKLKAALNVS